MAELDTDVVVVGASFAGLNFARVAAMNGLKVTVVEKDRKIGGTIRTTGIIFEEVMEELLIPTRFLTNRINRVYVYSPFLERCTLQGRTNRFFMSDTAGLIRWLAKQAEDAGARILAGTSFADYRKKVEGLEIVVRRKGKQEGITARFLVGADGAQSAVAKAAGLDRNTLLMEGTEWLYTGIKVEPDSFHVFMDHEIAPGYVAWVVPHGRKTAVGAAGYLGQYKGKQAMEQFLRRAGMFFDFSKAKLVERKAGIIPANPPLERTHNDHCLLLGDAAGQCGAFTLGGIFEAMVSGAIAGRLVARYLLAGKEDSLEKYQKEWRSHDRMGRWLEYESFLRKVYRRTNSNVSLERLFSRLNTEHGKELCSEASFYATTRTAGQSLRKFISWDVLPPLLKSYARQLLRRLR